MSVDINALLLRDIRRLAAVDMYGSAGSRLRRRIILAEFIAGALGCCGLGLWTLATQPLGGWTVFGLWVAGVGVNYIPLALHAIALFPGRRLESELAGVDIWPELRYYTAAQFWIFAPAVLLVLAIRQEAERRRT
ncbi:hypothetical protein EF847_14975 [Actinobacteria bacterium YIM 96077]|uniref:Uncharacterized protein n=2 Tax=Phytoactinopolyspora halophila TaxID=1981511 RepID=A0A329QUB4_9ACTN|nr:hypothetical protein EF847_14975 [Actinobacteria bacterium YIM 96077]RAW15651.1 hypothetical protein DPM12_08365 [Phytoactinopolyspora halophila]